MARSKSSNRWLEEHVNDPFVKQAQVDTRGYLKNLRNRMRTYIDGGGDIIGSVQVDQSEFDYLDLFDALAGRNAQTVYQQMEWE